MPEQCRLWLRRTTRSKPAKHVAELTPWELAERGREQFEAIPEASRTKADYTAAMDAFRAVYHQSPQDVHAASAVYSVAELLTEQGRRLHDAKSLKAAIGQYEFLRKQYPGSSLRVPALLGEGQIYGNDLGDSAAAKERYQLLLKQYPRSAQAEEARAGLEGRSAAPKTQAVAAPSCGFGRRGRYFGCGSAGNSGSGRRAFGRCAGGHGVAASGSSGRREIRERSTLGWPR